MFENDKALFRGRPRTTERRDRAGRRVFRVVAYHQTPGGERTGDITALVFVLMISLMPLAVAFKHQSVASWTELLTFLVAPWILLPVMRRGCCLAEVKASSITMHVDRFTLPRKRIFPRRFDPHQPHKFVMRQHDKAPEEQRAHELKIAKNAQRRRIVRPKPYYGDAYVIYLEYYGQRHDWITVYGRKNAEAIFARVRAIDGLLAAEATKHGRSEFEDDKGWNAQPGGL